MSLAPFYPDSIPMRLRRFLPRLSCTLVLLAGLAATLAAAQTAAPRGEKPPPPDVVLHGDGVCTTCHDESETYPVLSIGQTAHGTQADRRTPTCVDCHGESKTHVRKPRGADERPKPGLTYGGQLLSVPAEERVDRYFGIAGKRTSTGVAERNAVCLGCHQGGKRIYWQGSAHAQRDVACTSCHQIHTRQDRVRDKRTQYDICVACHKEQRVQFLRPSRHPTPEGKVACSDCHNPHGTAGAKLLVRDTVNKTCFQCHVEKRGPFLWNHQPVTEDCSICHSPHGSTVSGLLKTRAPFLCQQCHEASGHRGNLPSLSESGRNRGRTVTLARSCANCHANTHGGNSPLDAAAARGLLH